MVGDPSWYDRPASIVEGQIRDMWSYAQDSLDTAKSLMGGLGNFDLGPLPVAPTFAGDLAEGVPSTGTPALPGSQSFGTIDAFALPTFEDPASLLVGIDDATSEPPAFNPSIAGLSIPATPAPIDTSGLPVRPALDSVVIPDAPTLVMPTMPSLQDIVIPTFAFPDLPVFDETAPEFLDAPPSVVMNWAEPVYESELLDELTDKVRWMLEGGTGIPPIIEQALFDQARMREDITAGKAVSEAFGTWAGRGFELPPGMLVEQVNAAFEQNQLQVNALSREILTKSAVWEIENLRFAVQQGLALEQLLVTIFNNMAQRTFDAAKYQVESSLSLFNAQVSLFNARQTAYTAAANVYETRLKGELSKLDVFRAEIEGQKAIGEANEQQVKVYQARLSALTTEVDIYKARMEGARVQADVAKNALEAYKADISAYAERLNADKSRFEAYKVQVEAESAKAGILESESRAFAATVQAFESKNNIKVQKIRARVEAIQAMVSKYTSLIEAERSRVNAQVSVVQANTSAYTADVGRYTAEVQANSSTQELAARLIEARMRNNIALFDVKIKEYEATVTRIIEIARLKNEAMKGASTVAAQIAAGAMAGMHVSASLSGSGSLSGSDSLSISHNHNYDES